MRLTGDKPLFLFDLSNVFDTIVLQMVHSFINLTGTTLDWFHSYLSDRKQSVYYGDGHFKLASFRYSVLQRYSNSSTPTLVLEP